MGVKDIWAKGALAEELDALSLNMAGVSDKIGKSNDTGGTTTVGSLMAKANALLDGKGKASILKTADFQVTRGFPKIAANSKYLVKTLTGRGKVIINVGSNSGVIIITIDGIEKSIPSSVFLTQGNYDYLQHEFEFNKGFSLVLQNINNSEISSFYSLSYQLE